MSTHSRYSGPGGLSIGGLCHPSCRPQLFDRASLLLDAVEAVEIFFDELALDRGANGATERQGVDLSFDEVFLRPKLERIEGRLLVLV
jgi:hypothetical protein